MADCNETIRELDAFLDGELSDDARGSIHGHLDGCVDCLQAYDFHAELRKVIQDKCNNDEMPPGLLERIERCLQTDLDGDGTIGGEPL